MQDPAGLETEKEKRSVTMGVWADGDGGNCSGLHCVVGLLMDVDECPKGEKTVLGVVQDKTGDNGSRTQGGVMDSMEERFYERRHITSNCHVVMIATIVSKKLLWWSTFLLAVVGGVGLGWFLCSWYERLSCCSSCCE